MTAFFMLEPETTFVTSNMLIQPPNISSQAISSQIQNVLDKPLVFHNFTPLDPPTYITFDIWAEQDQRHADQINTAIQRNTRPRRLKSQAFVFTSAYNPSITKWTIFAAASAICHLISFVLFCYIFCNRRNSSNAMHTAMALATLGQHRGVQSYEFCQDTTRIITTALTPNR